MPSRFPPLGSGFFEIPVNDAPEILALAPGEMIPGGAIIAVDAVREIRVGELLARLTADVAGLGSEGQYIARKSTEAAALSSTGANTVTVDDAHPFEVGDTLEFTGGADDEVVESIDYDTNIITIVGTISGADVDPNDRVFVTADGQGTAVGIAAVRYTPNSTLTDGAIVAQQDIFGKVAMYVAGSFKKNKLHGSADGVDVQGDTDLGGYDIIGNHELIYRIG